MSTCDPAPLTFHALNSETPFEPDENEHEYDIKTDMGTLENIEIHLVTSCGLGQPIDGMVAEPQKVIEPIKHGRISIGQEGEKVKPPTRGGSTACRCQTFDQLALGHCCTPSFAARQALLHSRAPAFRY